MLIYHKTLGEKGHLLAWRWYETVSVGGRELGRVQSADGCLLVSRR